MALLEKGKQQRELRADIERTVSPCREPKAVLPFWAEGADDSAQIAPTRQGLGKPISMADAQIAAICLEHRAACATRNVKDFFNTGVEVVNPWDADPVPHRLFF